MADGDCDHGTAQALVLAPDSEQALTNGAAIPAKRDDDKKPAEQNGTHELKTLDQNTDDAASPLDSSRKTAEESQPNGNKENNPSSLQMSTKRKEKRAQNRKEKKEKKNMTQQRGGKNDALSCSYCSCNFAEKSEFQNHCKTEEHLQVIMSDEGRNWQFRPPPRISGGNDTFKICVISGQGGTCRFASQCADAHSEAELNEWRERLDYRQKKAKKASKLYKSFNDNLLEKLSSQGIVNNVLKSDLENVECHCENSANQTMTSKSEEPITWIFLVRAKAVLRNVSLLSEMSEVANYFNLVSIKEMLSFKNGEILVKTHQFNSTDIEWSRDNAYVKESSYRICVRFYASIYGTFRQSVILSFGETPYLRKDICVDVKPLDDSETLDEEDQKLQELQNVLISQSERWDKYNCTIHDFTPPLQIPNPEDLFLYQSYPTPQPSTFKASKSVIEPHLTKKNFRSRMHELLYIEEMAQFEQIAQFNVKATLNLISKYLLTPSSTNTSTAKYARPGELFGKMGLKGSLSEDTTAGRLILTNNCTSLLLKPVNAKKSLVVYVAGMEDSGKSTLYLRLSSKLVKDFLLKEGEEFQVEVQFQLNRLPLCEMHWAIDRIPDLSLVYPDLNYGRKISIPWTPGKQWSEELEAKLNPKQREAILAITSDLDSVPLPPILIIGPYGTGKTFTLAKAIRILLKQEGSKILVCTHSNSAADLYIREYLDPYIMNGNAQVKLLRVYYKNRWVQTVHTSVQKYCLINDEDRTFRNPTKEDVLKCNIVVATLATSRYLSTIGLPIGHFTHILIDEAAQAMECEAIMPLALAKANKTRVVLAGDHMQLSPEVFSSFAQERKFNKSLLERLYDLYPAGCSCKILLCENYRSHEAIISYTSDLFYEQKLLASGRQLKHDFWHPLTVFTARGTDVQDSNSTSFYNNAEVYEVVDRVAELQKTWPKAWGHRDENSIGIVTPYYDQVQRIRSELRKRKLFGVSVERVLNVQGKQFRAIILSTVRTRRTCVDQDQHDTDFGFLSNAKLLNTAITRAQSLVAVVGDPVALCSVGKCRKLWERFVDISRKHNSLFGTTWSALKVMLGSCELNKKFILNPLAPEFIPRARRQQEAYLNPILLALQSKDSFRQPHPAPVVPYGFFHPAQAPFVAPNFYPPRFYYHPLMPIVDPAAFPFPPFPPLAQRPVSFNRTPPPASIQPPLRPNFRPATMKNIPRNPLGIPFAVPMTMPLTMPMPVRPTMAPPVQISAKSIANFAFLSDGVHFPPVPSTPPPTKGATQENQQPLKPSQRMPNQNLLDAACELLPLDIELTLFLKSHDLQMAWFTSLAVKKSEKDAMLYKELIVVMQQHPDLIKDIQARLEVKKAKMPQTSVEVAETTTTKSSDILMPSASSADAFYTLANVATVRKMSPNSEESAESIVSEMLKFNLSEDEDSEKFCSNGESPNLPLYKRRALVMSGSSDDSSLSKMSFSDCNSDSRNDFFDFGAASSDRSRSSTMPSTDLSAIWNNPGTSNRTYANVLRQPNDLKKSNDVSDPLLKLRQQGTRGSQELSFDSENLTKNNYQPFSSAFGSKW